MSIQSYQAEISHAYGDVMRSIIIAIYEYDIENIYIIRKSDDKQVIALPESIQRHTEKLKHSITCLITVSLSLVVTIFMNG